MKRRAKLLYDITLCWVVSLIAASQVALADSPPQKLDINTQPPSPTAFTYQGQLKDANGPVNGTFDLQFVLYSAQTGSEKLGVSEMEEVVLTNGMFSFQLDFGHIAVEAKESWLEIGVRPSGSAEAYTVLFPRQKLTPTPYAIFAQHEQWSLIGVPVGFADRAVMAEGAKAGIEADGATKLKEDESLKPTDQAAAAPQGTANFIAKFDGAGNPTANSVMFDNGTNVGIGTTNPQARLHIFSNDNDAFKITNTALPGMPTVRMGVDTLGLFIEPNDSNSSIRLNANPSLIGLYVQGNGNVGIGTRNPFRLLTIGSSFDAAFTIEPTNGTPNAGYIRFGDQTGWKLHFGRSRERSAGPLNTGTTGVLMTIQDNGNVGLGTIAPDAKLHVFGPVRVHAAPPNDTTPDNAEFVLTNRGAGGAPYTWRLQTAAVGGGFGVNPNALEIWEYPQDATPGCCLPRLRILPGGTRGSAPPPVTILENGTLQTSVLQIFGGGDLAEPFEISQADSIQPGLVVAIDPDQPGHLRIADRAYDRTVAGIISGANGINPGLTMKQAGSVADGAHPVSLTGRVYCWADASYGPIAPGDLLTTSDTPGHAMKVTDHTKAQGAIIGKAMTKLERGKGLVLVLVTLQ